MLGFGLFLFAFFFTFLHILNGTQKSQSEFESLSFCFCPVTIVGFLEFSQVSKHLSPRSHAWRNELFSHFISLVLLRRVLEPAWVSV